MISSINPSVKAIAVLIPGVLLGFMFDIFTPLAYFIFILLVTFTISGISIVKWLKIFSAFLVLVLGFAWMTMLYASDTYAGGEVLFEVWEFDVTTGSVMIAISLALRSMCFLSLSLLFVLTTDSTKFMLSLMQQLKLPPKLTYGILAGYRFLPTFQEELSVLRKAHRIRGVKRSRGIRGRINQFKRYSIPLLANAIRKAERVAIAMESKGFTDERDRTHYHEMKVRTRDWVFFGAIVGMFFVIVITSYSLGYLNIFGRKV
ncbi:hypothetical protein CEY16_10335 [Halalkalibacillus sediminis]|uniref:Energy-coupling factor transporter transmembrane protein EcfT n=1 Tax=Halalkalibacillus sediminis TaxID=2018042 RepID=A0A2I0QS46_9BACI|nr:energy-coupling factor transporter transmembrane component T [Halalkalibacillus sediminis]PKR77134.1 hypothetical protein CEY16_10335 [Halalkalibacillus sediminis]